MISHQALLEVPFHTIRSSERVEPFLHDEAHLLKGKATKVFFPLNEEEIGAILKEANIKNIPVTIAGAGTGVTGARVPLDGWVISTEDLTHAVADGGEEISFEDMGKTFVLYKKKDVFCVPVAMTLAQLNACLADHQVLYPPDPTETSASLGGTLATNASGARSFRYGPTRAWIQGLRVILPNGELLDIKRGEYIAKQGEFIVQGKTIALPKYLSPLTVKSVAGYHITQKQDLIDLFIGAEGTLGVITSIDIRTIPLPSSVSIVAYFEEYGDLRTCLERLRPEAISLEYLDAASLRLLRESHSSRIPSLARCALMIETPRLDTVQALLEVCIDIWVADTTATREEHKRFRHALPESINTLMRTRKMSKLATDFSVPWQKLDVMMQHYTEAMNRFGPNTALFGHIGNAHLHLNFMYADATEKERAEDLMLDLAKKAIELGGTVSAEHGVGKKRLKGIPLLEIMYPKESLHQMWKIKETLDPKMLLNKGNIFPWENQ